MNVHNLAQIEKHAVPSHIVVTTLQDYPYSGYELRNETVVGTGYAFEILDLMKQYFNFTYTIRLPNEDINNEYEAAIRLLVKKQVDMVVAFLPLLPELRKQFIYGTVLDEIILTFFMKRPPESATGSGLLAPFDTTVWLFILITVLFVGPSIYFLITLRSKFATNAKKENYSLGACMWFVYGALLKQGSTMTPVSSPTRLLFATWWIFIIILTAFYTANLTAFLTLSEFTLPINSIDSLINKHLRWFAFKGRLFEYMMENNYTEVSKLKYTYAQYGELIEDSNKIIDYDVLSRVHENAVFITELLYAKLTLYEQYKEKMFTNLREEQRCEYVIMPGDIYKVNRAFGYVNKSVLYRQFNRLTKKMIEGGMIKHFKSQNLSNSAICPLDLASKERNLRLKDLKMTYHFMFIGLAIATGIFILEFMYKCYLKNNNHDKAGKIATQKIIRGYWFRAFDDVVKNNNNNKSRKDKSNDINNNNNSNDSQTVKVSVSEKSDAVMKNINGREYYVTNRDSERRLIPVRCVSAIMYQNYTQGD